MESINIPLGCVRFANSSQEYSEEEYSGALSTLLFIVQNEFVFINAIPRIGTNTFIISEKPSSEYWIWAAETAGIVWKKKK